MNITSLGSVGSRVPLNTDLTQTSGSTPGSAGGADFGSALKQAASSLAELSGNADQQALAMATGAPVDVHQVMLSLEQASLGFQTAMQVRNKLVDAYQEVMRMSL